jgi:hypothetical protein
MCLVYLYSNSKGLFVQYLMIATRYQGCPLREVVPRLWDMPRPVAIVMFHSTVKETRFSSECLMQCFQNSTQVMTIPLKIPNKG